MIHFGCQICGQKFTVKDSMAGRTSKCPKCNESIRVPDAENNAPVKQAQKPSTAPIHTQSTNDSEHIIWNGQPSPKSIFVTLVLCGFFFWLVIPIFVALIKWLEIKCTKYELTNERFRYTRGILSRRMDEMELYRVKDTILDEPFQLRLFGLAQIRIKSGDVSTRSTSIIGIPLEEAREVRETIRNCVETIRERKRVRQLDYN